MPDHQRILDALRLVLVPGVGPRLQQTLLNRFGGPAEVFAATRQELLGVSGVGKAIADAVRGQDSQAAREEFERCEAAGVQIMLRGDSGYPAMLGEIIDPPTVFYVRGELKPEDQLAVAIVGSRRCTTYGKRIAARLGSALANAGLTIVSGLARGIDAAAHRGALEAGGRTIAVMATGHGSIYPPEHKDLANEISASGAVVTEMPFGQAPLPGLFPQRNRIISGLSLGSILIEAAKSSGALHTARHAYEQGREVMAVPGAIDNLANEGCHHLIRDGATLIRHADDVLEALGPLVKPVKDAASGLEVRTPQELSLTDQERQVLEQVTTEPKHIDEVIRDCPLEASRTLSTLTVLEMKRLVRRQPGGYMVRTPR